MMSSRHDPYEMGYTCVTMMTTKGTSTECKRNPQKSSKCGLFSATREHEGGITSNRGSARHGEFVPEPCTHRPSRSGNLMEPRSIP